MEGADTELQLCVCAVHIGCVRTSVHSCLVQGDQATLIPSEFHIVQHSGVHGTEFKDE